MFRQNIDKRIEALEDVNYADTDYQSYKDLTDADIKVLKAGGYQLDEVVDFKFLNFTCSRQMNSFYDVRDIALAGRIKSVALNAGDLKLLPFEDALFEVGHIPNYRQTVRVPKGYLKNYANARDAVLKLLPSSAVTFSEMKKLLRSHLATIKKLDASFVDLEWEVLEEHAETAAINKVEKGVLDALPDEKHGKSFVEVYTIIVYC